MGRRERERGIGGIGWSDFERRKERKRGRNGDRVGEEGGKGRTEGGTEEAEQGRTSLDRHPHLRAAPRARFRVRVQVWAGAGVSGCRCERVQVAVVGAWAHVLPRLRRLLTGASATLGERRQRGERARGRSDRTAIRLLGKPSRLRVIAIRLLLVGIRSLLIVIDIRLLGIGHDRG